MWFLFPVRSLGSIALRKAEDVDFKYHFNFFSVNFNEELVALYGGSLQRQTKFVHECIKVILKLYRVSSDTSIWEWNSGLPFLLQNWSDD